MWNSMRMDPTDLADAGGHVYTYLLNGITPAGNWSAAFTPGERVRLRIVNGSSMSFFDLRIPGLPLTVVAADGQDVEPVTVDELRIGTAEVYDVIVSPRDAAYTIFAQSMDRSGFARGTLAPRAGLAAEVPALDKPVLLGMDDMGMHHAGMDHSQMSPIRHAPTENSPIVDMQAAMAMPRLDDPGVGLRNNGRRVLTYADLATLGGPNDARDAAREIELHLTGHMERSIWSFNGQKFSDAAPLPLRHGERLRVTLVNDTMMTHPIHLHGMWSEVTDARGAFRVRKHTVSIQPAQRLSYLVTADALGRWAYHCHLLYHMEAGMFREVVVA
jgi:FtsP/CotA-like multicopper oxidase with cupredoxin domain